MKKKLDTADIMNELRGQSAFFPNYQKAKQQEENKDAGAPAPKGEQKEPVQQKAPPAERYHDTVIPRHHDTMVSRNHDTTHAVPEDDILLEKARKAVKQIGKEAATHRFTLEEKTMLADIEYTYRRKGIRTSENEITRIAINYFAEDYHKNGEESLLAKVLKLLNA